MDSALCFYLRIGAALVSATAALFLLLALLISRVKEEHYRKQQKIDEAKKEGRMDCEHLKVQMAGK